MIIIVLTFWVYRICLYTIYTNIFPFVAVLQLNY